MTPITDIADARRALRRFLPHGEEALSPALFEQLEELVDSPSPVDAIVRSAELLYARRAELDDEARDLVGRLAAFAGVNGWHGMATANRGGLILQAMERDVEAAAVSIDEIDPAAAPEYVDAAPPADAAPAK
jgi:hypothetical protein